MHTYMQVCAIVRISDAINPDHWYKHIHPSQRDDSRGNSPLTLSAPPRPVERKPRTADGDLFKRKGTVYLVVSFNRMLL